MVTAEILSPRRSVHADLWAVVRRMPFTLLMVAGILLVTTASRSLLHPLRPELVDRWGFGLDALRNLEFYRLLTAPFEVYRPYMALTICSSLLLVMGACEVVVGTRRTAAIAWGSFLAGYVGTNLLLWPAVEAGWPWAVEMTRHADVGASAMIFGALGALVPNLPLAYRQRAFWAVWIYLFGMLALEFKVWDINHLLAYPVGLLGAWPHLRGRGETWSPTIPSIRLGRRERPAVTAWLVAVMGFLTVLSSLTAPRYPLLRWAEESIPIELAHAGRHANLVLGFALLLLARGLSRRRRQAWSLAVISVVPAIVLHVVKGIDWPEATLGLGLLTLLILWRGEFTAASDPPSVRDGYIGLAGVALLLPFYTLLGLHLFRIHPAEGITPFLVLRETGWRLLFADATGVVARNHHQAWLLNSVSVLGWAGVLYAVVMTARGVVAPPRTLTDLEAAGRLVALHGRTGTDYMALWPGNHAFFSPGRGAFVAYRQSSEAALALGDPIGIAADRRAAILAFGERAQSQGLAHAFFAATEAMLPLYQELGYTAIKIGEEAVVPLPALEFKGKEWQSTRTALNKAARDGVSIRMYEGGSVPPDLLDQMFAISEEWQRTRKLPPMDFTLGTTEDVRDPNLYVAVAVDAQGRVHAFADWLPVPATRGWVIDVMRRHNEAMSGVMEFLIASSLLFFKARGDREASLGTAPLADLAPGDREALLGKVMGFVYERGDALYNFRTLFEYKAKFQPEWRGTYLVYQATGDLPRVLLALLRAYFPDLSPKVLGEMIGAAIF